MHDTHGGAWEEIRTPDLRITNALLYRLSYPGASSKDTRNRSRDQSRHRSELHQRQHQVVQQQVFVDVRREAAGGLGDGLDRAD